MKINSRKFKKSLEECRKCISKPLNDKSDVLLLNGNSPDARNSKELNKCNNDTIQYNLQYNLFALTAYTCYKNVISKCSILAGLYQIFLIEFILANAITQALDLVNAEETNGEDPSGDGASGGTLSFLKSSFSCLSDPSGNPDCLKRMFLILSLCGTFLSLIGGVLSLLYRFCSCFMCCRRKPRQRPGNEANNRNKQLELMQMQMQQQQMCNALMNSALTKRGEQNKGKKKGRKKKKNNDSSNETKKPRKKKKSNDSSNERKKPRKKKLKDDIYVGYQKEQE
ncbi:hypothetical protein POVWA2_023870 [Plasmodium ovale wallikeri]|uniref:PIR Superfamily Protein n=1 Tax=Plasmodium ovale wallikeri TaxID=864142 RepID=A0A1A8YT02_PLAOA|nr:hypothetical protein POVWA1_023980 [Plasmodium ovale wallikeri]SBT35209.1 hypothetical protein POVWA2_023870 [Plasmodium ovale wallikeri]